MTGKERKLAAALLELASEQFSNHGCNDLDMSLLAGWTEAEKAQLALDYIAFNGDPDDKRSLDQISDWELMHFFADRIETNS